MNATHKYFSNSKECDPKTTKEWSIKVSGYFAKEAKEIYRWDLKSFVSAVRARAMQAWGLELGSQELTSMPGKSGWPTCNSILRRQKDKAPQSKPASETCRRGESPGFDWERLLQSIGWKSRCRRFLTLVSSLCIHICTYAYTGPHNTCAYTHVNMYTQTTHTYAEKN